MCNHTHKPVFIRGLSETCIFPSYFKKLAREENLRYKDLPTDKLGKCIFHSEDIAWKRQHQCGERFLELLFHQAEDEALEDIDFREIILTGIDWEEGSIIPIGNLHFPTHVRFQGAKFLDELLIEECIFEEAADFDEAVFKSSVNLKNCYFKGMVSFIGGCRFEGSFMGMYCEFEESADFHNAVFMHQVNFTGGAFRAETMFTGVQQIAANATISQFVHLSFSKYTSFINASFNASLVFDHCEFSGETHFEDTVFKKRFQLIEPIINDKLFFLSHKKDKKLFENVVEFELREENFGEFGQILFQNTNLFNFNNTFKEQLKPLELNHKIDIGEGCLIYRASIERIFPYTRIHQMILDDLSRAFRNYFEHFHSRSLNVEMFRDFKKDQIKIIYHTDENISLAEFEELVFEAKAATLDLLLNVNQKVSNSDQSNLEADHYLQLLNIWRRFKLAIENNLTEQPLLKDFFLSHQKEQNKQLMNLLNLTINMNVEQLQIDESTAIHNHDKVEKQVNVNKNFGNINPH